MKQLKLLIISIVFIGIFCIGCTVQIEKQNITCEEWIKQVDESSGATTRHTINFDTTISEKQFNAAVECLLKCKGNKNPARFSGATSVYVSQILPTASVEIAALYYISVLFLKNWQHGDGIAIWNERGINPSGAMEIAYLSYEKWFKQVKEIGLSNARKINLNPLEGTDLSWYGK